MKRIYWLDACTKKQYVHTYMIYGRKSNINVLKFSKET
jgi:hypothetical protein